MIRSVSKFLFLVVITLGVYFIFRDFAGLKLNTADASTYLNIAENITSHKGFTVSFDLYQFFKTPYHPLWPFMQPVYPLLCALVFMAHGAIEQVIKVNLFIMGLNAALAFYIIRFFVPSRLNLLFLVCLIFPLNFFFTALFPWTEQLYLFIFLITFFLFNRFPGSQRVISVVGALNGVLFLIRVSQIYSIPAYLLMMVMAKGERGQRLKNIFAFMAGFCIVLGPYQMFNLLVFHSLYPEYIKPAADYTLAHISNASFYKPGQMGIFNHVGFKFTLASIGYFYGHVVGLCQNFSFSFIPILAYLSIPGHKKDGWRFVLNCLFQSAFIIIGYAFSFHWDPHAYYLEILRYSLVPYVLASLAGWYCFYELFFGSGIKWKKLFTVFLLFNFAFFTFYNFIKLRRDLMKYPRTQMSYYVDLYASDQWINKSLPEKILVASDDDQEAYFMHRPFISMPPGRSYNCSNLKLYNEIHGPDYYLLSKQVPDTCFGQIPHTQIYSNRTFRILKIKK